MATAKDKNGMTEEQFLRLYDVTKYFRPSVTVDAVLFDGDGTNNSVLLIKRGGHPFLGDFAFPGGFVEKDEACESAVARELNEETGLNGIPLFQLVTVSTPERDPRCRNITVVFAAKNRAANAVGGDDATDAKVFDYTYTRDGRDAVMRFTADGEEPFDVKVRLVFDAFGDVDINNSAIVERGRLAFDHAKVVCYLTEKLRLRCATKDHGEL